ncbi:MULTISPECIES: isochorismatase family protein [Luteimonas]|uniref:isochorismatase family protein n=1 Tax=Luteimonas TaxID=83614 RepID=UPI000C7BA917|nr:MULTISPECIES: isochorismatase family protein [Luteimonas]
MGLPKIAPYPLPTAAELPAARGRWIPEPSRAALLVHDMQRYFLAAFAQDDAPLAPAIQNLAHLLAHCRSAGIPVFYTAQRGHQDRRDRGLQADLWGPGMQASPEGDHVLVKHRYSAFQRSNLDTLMRARGRDQLLITGVYAHIGVLSTATDAFQRDIETFVVADAVADFSRADHDLALHWIARTCGVPLTTDRLLEMLQ